MRLTDHERNMIARRAAGEYAIIPSVKKIVTKHRKNKDPGDQIFLRFARLITKKSWSEEDYDHQSQMILDKIPEPWGPLPSIIFEPAGVDTKISKKRVVTCRICSQTGHNARTCPDKPPEGQATVECADGLTRLAPGFDPNPPSEVEEGQEN